MTDAQETLKLVAKGYHDLMALERQRRATIAEMIRSCLHHMDSTQHSRKYREGVKGLQDLAAMLEKENAPPV